jgi:hypothetical protein
MGSTANALANAKKALEKANNFTGSATKQAGNVSNPFTPPKDEGARSAAAPTDYSHARSARASAGHEFMGVRSDEAPELNSALEQRATAEKALQQ